MSCFPSLALSSSLTVPYLPDPGVSGHPPRLSHLSLQLTHEDPYMQKKCTATLSIYLLLAASLTAHGNGQTVLPELDAFWAELSRTVAEGDFEGYSLAYHEDAVLVSDFSSNSYPISQALDGWESGFIDVREGRAEAGVEFKFTQRLYDASTAHETGIFHYWTVNAQGQRIDQYVHFEALLVKRDGWKMVMEYQKAPASEEDWNEIG